MNQRIARQGWPLLAAGLLVAAGVLSVPLFRGSSSPNSATLSPRLLTGPRPELPDLQRAVAIPDEPMDIRRTRVGKPELHGFAVRGASGLRQDPAPVAFLHRKRELRDGGCRDLRARQLCQPASRTTSLRRPCSTSSREERTERSPSRRYLATSSLAGPPPATASRPSTMAVRQRESTPRTPPTISLAAPALWRLQHRPGLERSPPGRPSAATLALAG